MENWTWSDSLTTKRDNVFGNIVENILFGIDGQFVIISARNYVTMYKNGDWIGMIPTFTNVCNDLPLNYSRN